MTEGSMELWSNPVLSEFVIMFNSESVARTSLEGKCDKKLDEMPYKEGYDYNWNYTLSHWVVFYLSNKYLKPFSAAKTAQHQGFKIETDIDFEDSISLILGIHRSITTSTKRVLRWVVKKIFTRLRIIGLQLLQSVLS
jgi:hypothetical protein